VLIVRYMKEIIVFICAFLVSVVFVYAYILLNKKKGFLTGVDINKENKPVVPESGGIPVLFSLGFLLAGFSLGSAIMFTTENLAWLLLVALFAAIGVLDDSKHKFMSKATPWPLRALPIAAISLGFALAFTQDLFLVLAGGLFIAALASFHNTFAGLNGWEVGSSFIISMFVAYLLLGSPYFLVAVLLAGGTLALLVFNVYPAKIFPGDSGTMLLGSGLAGLVLLNNDIKTTLVVCLFYVPHLIDFFALKLLTNRMDVSQASTKPYVLKNNRIAIPAYKGKTRYDFAKLVVKLFGPMKEKKIVLIIWIVVLVNCSFWILVSQAF